MLRNEWTSSAIVSQKALESIDPSLTGIWFEELFESESKSIASLGNSLSNDEKLKLYGLYKQAKEGDNTKSRPGGLAFEAQSKWHARSQYKGLSKMEAMKQYVDLVTEKKRKQA